MCEEFKVTLVRKRKSAINILVLIIILMLILFLNLPDELGQVYRKCYIINIICLGVCLFIYALANIRGVVDLFSPITFFTIIYCFMFFITPVYDLLIGEITWFGIDFFDQGVKCSVYALLGYLIFFIAYSIMGSNEWGKYAYYNNDEREICYNEKIRRFIILGYIICLIANIFYLVNASGTSIMYVLSLGILGTAGKDVESSLGAISMLSYALPSFTLLYIEYGRNRILKIVAFLLMFELQVARGFRFLILQIIVMFGAYYFLKNDKKPKISQLILASAVALIPILLMTLFRNSIRTGLGMDMTLVSKNTIMDAMDAAFWENLRIYKNYYAIVKVVPDKTPFLHGAQTIIYTAIMLIPRAIWKAKPGNPGTVAQNIALGRAAVLGGSAYPALGEYYYDWGICGIIIWMFIWGAFLKKIERRYRFNMQSKIDLMIFCTVLGVVLQFTIRGYMPSNFWMLVFCIIPYWLVKKLRNGQ